MEKKYWIIVGIIVLLLTFAGGYFTKGTIEEPVYVEKYNTQSIDSLSTILVLKFDSLAVNLDTLINDIKIKQDDLEKNYKKSSNIRYIVRDDSLLSSVIRATNPTQD